tara:strand:+ start:876 stop:1145 length:270 start_codon:yes stop_codon:yes gene_type:complete
MGNVKLPSLTVLENIESTLFAEWNRSSNWEDITNKVQLFQYMSNCAQVACIEMFTELAARAFSAGDYGTASVFSDITTSMVKMNRIKFK